MGHLYKKDISVLEAKECGVRNEACQVGYGNSDTASEEYGGYVRHSEHNGRTQCQMWSSSIPHNTSQFNTLAEDWCRNPDESGGVWCYNMDPEKRWDYCPVRRCSYCDTGFSDTNYREN